MYKKIISNLLTKIRISLFKIITSEKTTELVTVCPLLGKITHLD